MLQVERVGGAVLGGPVLRRGGAGGGLLVVAVGAGVAAAARQVPDHGAVEADALRVGLGHKVEEVGRQGDVGLWKKIEFISRVCPSPLLVVRTVL